MKNKLWLAMSVVFVGGCSSGPDAFTYPEGELVSVNGTGIPFELIEYIERPVASPVVSSSPIAAQKPVNSSFIKNVDLASQVANKVAATSGAAVATSTVADNSSLSKQDVGGANHSAVTAKEEVKAASVNPFPMLRMGYGETPLIAIKRWAAARGYTNVITDVSPELNARLAKKTEEGVSYDVTLDAALVKMSKSFSAENKELLFFTSKIPDEHTLVIHDKGLGREAKIFWVNPGPIMDNAFRLAKSIGWNTEPRSWAEDAPNPDEPSKYSIVVFNDPIDAFRKLLAHHDVTALLVPSTNTVYFTKAE